MSNMNFYSSHLTLWPATPLTAGVARELTWLGVDLAAIQVNKGTLSASRAEEVLVLDFGFQDMLYGLTDLEAVLATLRLADISYVAWDLEDGAAAGNGRAYDARLGIEQRFTVTPAGEPVLSVSDLEEFEDRCDTAEDLISALQASLRLAIPAHLTPVAAGEAQITIQPSDEQPDHQIESVAFAETHPTVRG